MHPESWPVYTLNNHDTPRSASRFHASDDDERLKVAAALTMTLRGTPYLYYGEEIGMRNIKVPRHKILDPVGKKYWPIFDGRDKLRSPMQWDPGQNAGFSTGEPWLPVHPNFITRNVELQRKDPQSLFNFYKRIIQVRKDYPALRTGMFQPLTFEPQKLLAYIRQLPGQTALVALNFGRRPVRFAMGADLRRRNWRLVISNKRDELPGFQNGGMLPLLGDEVMILVAED